MSDSLAEGRSTLPVKEIETAFKDTFRLSRIYELSRGAQSSVEYVKGSDRKGAPAGLRSKLRLRYPTARGSALFLELIIWDADNARGYEVTYVGNRGAAWTSSSRKMAKKLVKEFLAQI